LADKVVDLATENPGLFGQFAGGAEILMLGNENLA
jgi:hypothetical protein